MWQGYVINLARSPGRWAAMAQRLAAAGAGDRYRRFEAVDGRTACPPGRADLDPGVLGCWLSHTGVWDLGRDGPAHLHCLEDDVDLGPGFVARLEAVLAHADARLPAWDLIYTDVHVPVSPAAFRELAAHVTRYRRDGVISLADLRGVAFAGATSYLVNRRAVGRLAGMAAGRWADGTPVDLFLRRLVRDGALTAFVTVPFLTAPAAENDASDIRGAVDRSRRVCDTLRRGFFLGADGPALLARMRDLTAGARPDPLIALFAEAQAFA